MRLSLVFALFLPTVLSAPSFPVLESRDLELGAATMARITTTLNTNMDQLKKNTTWVQINVSPATISFQGPPFYLITYDRSLWGSELLAVWLRDFVPFPLRATPEEAEKLKTLMLKYASSYRWGKYYNTMVKKKDALTTPLVNSPHAEYFLDSTVLSRTRNGFIFRVVKDRILPESGIQEIIEAEWQALAKKADEAIAVCQLGVDLG